MTRTCKLGAIRERKSEGFHGRLLGQRLGGCTKTRRSASPATTQNVAATSSGEAEFYALTKSASRALGVVGHGC